MSTTDAIPKIEIPRELLPTDGRFGCGPSAIRQEFVDDLAKSAPRLLGTSHRQATVRSWVGRLRQGLQHFFALPEGYRIGLGNGGASLVWEMANLGLFRRRSCHFTCGEFSAKWFQWAQQVPWLSPVEVKGEFGDLPEMAAVDGADAYCFTNCETSTGVAVPEVPILDTAALNCCDATSAAGGFLFDWSRIDFLLFSPQKCFGSEGGLGVFLISPRAIERHEEIRRDSSRYIPSLMSIHEALANSVQDQTYNTPAIATIYLMARQVEWLNTQGGMEHWAALTRAKAQFVYDWATRCPATCPYVVRPELRSPTVATIDLVPEIAAGTLSKVLRANGIVDTEAYRKLGRNQIRLGMFPNVSRENLERLTRSIEYVIERLAAA